MNKSRLHWKMPKEAPDGTVVLWEAAYRRGVLDRRHNLDGGLEVWGETEQSADYDEGWWAEHRRLAKEAGSA